MKHRPLVALSSAAILAVYTAGYVRTRSASERFAVEAAPRRAATAAPPRTEAAGPLVASEPTAAAVPRPRVEPRLRTPVVGAPSSPAPQLTPASPGADSQSAETQAAAPIATEPPAPPEPQTAPVPAAISEYKDGSYVGWGFCRHGDLLASVTIEQGRITSATVLRCLTRYSCSWIEPLYPQVVSRQSAEVDYVSGATESTDAFHDAVVEALSKAR